MTTKPKPEPLKEEGNNKDTLYNLIEFICQKVCEEIKEQLHCNCELNKTNMLLLKQLIKTEFGDDILYMKQDVKAAVQWLKEKLSKEMDKGIWKYEIHNTIDEAFPDITDSPSTANHKGDKNEQEKKR